MSFFQTAARRRLVNVSAARKKEVVDIGEISPLSVAKWWVASASHEAYAIFAGGETSSTPTFTSTADAYDSSLTKLSTPSLSAATRMRSKGTTVGQYAIFGGGSISGSHSNIVNAYNSALTRSNPTALSVARIHLNTTNIGIYALFAGGQVNTVGSTAVDAYNESLTRTQPTALSQARGWLGAQSNSSYALVAGGYASTSDTGVVNAYNQNLTRTNPSPLSVARQPRLATATLGEYIFIGSSGGVYKVVDVYDGTLTRLTAAQTRTAIVNRSAVTLNEYVIFGAGGAAASPINEVDIYDSSLTRTNGPTFNVARTIYGAATIGRYAIFAGGSSGGSAKNTVEAFALV